MSHIFSELNLFHLVPDRYLANVIICSGAINETNAYPTLDSQLVKTQLIETKIQLTCTYSRNQFLNLDKC